MGDNSRRRGPSPEAILATSLRTGQAIALMRVEWECTSGATGPHFPTGDAHDATRKDAFNGVGVLDERTDSGPYNTYPRGKTRLWPWEIPRAGFVELTCSFSLCIGLHLHASGPGMQVSGETTSRASLSTYRTSFEFPFGTCSEGRAGWERPPGTVAPNVGRQFRH